LDCRDLKDAGRLGRFGNVHNMIGCKEEKGPDGAINGAIGSGPESRDGITTGIG
jgi:hypothetical protein